MPVTVSETFAAAGARTTATVQSLTGMISGVSGSGTNFGGGVSLAYDAATGAYTVRDANGLSQSFLAADKTAFGDPVVDKTITSFSKTNGNVTDQLTLFNPGASNPKMTLSYVSYGNWQRLTTTGTSVDVAEQFFIYGIRQAANQPSTGSASYSTLVDGLWTNANGIYSLAKDFSGVTSFTADFATLKVSTTLDLAGSRVDDNSKSPLYFGRFSGTGSIAALGGGFAGSLTQQGMAGDGKVYSGSFRGAFFGPHGEEMGYTFSLTGAGGAAAGAVVGKAQ